MTHHEDNLHLMNAARQRARELRRETGEAYWGAATRFAHNRLRAARRLAAALARHRQSRTPTLEG